MEIEISLKSNTSIPEQAMSEFIDNVKQGNGFVTLDHNSHQLSLYDIAGIVKDVKCGDNGNMLADIEITKHFAGETLNCILESYPNNIRFYPNAIYHMEKDVETEEETIIVDQIISIDAEFVK